jgi:hypothetical protein
MGIGSSQYRDCATARWDERASLGFGPNLGMAKSLTKIRTIA